MKKTSILLALILAFSIGQSDAQILKGFGKKLEKKLEERIERKADRHVDKVIDKADKETDKPIDSVVDGKPAERSRKKNNDPVSADTTTKRGNSSIPTSTQMNTQSIADGILMMPGGNCSDFIWFKSGAMMEFETSDGKGGHLNTSKMRIINVENEGEVTVAKAIASDDEGNEYEMEYKCAGDKIYMDFGAMMKSAFEKSGQSMDSEVQNVMDNTQFGFSDGFMSFPKQMYPGQELDEVSFSMVSNPSPQVSMEILSLLTDRKVVAKENINIEAGSFDCVKITGMRKTSMKVMGMNRELDPVLEEVWFSPGIGIVKQNSYNSKGKIESAMELKSFKL